MFWRHRVLRGAGVCADRAGGVMCGAGRRYSRYEAVLAGSAGSGQGRAGEPNKNGAQGFGKDDLFDR